MMLDIAADNLGGDLITDGTGKIAIFPEFPAPEPSLDPGELTKDGPSAQALEPRHHVGDRIAGREGAKNMDMVGAHLHFLDGDVILLRNIPKELLYPLLDLPLQNVAPVLGRPNQVVQGIVNGMGGTSKEHATMVILQANLGSGHRARCQDRLFPPAANSGAA